MPLTATKTRESDNTHGLLLAKVLVVEDEKALADSIADWLSSSGHRVTTAYNGEEALNILQRGDFDIVVLDVVLPGLNGLELCRQYRRSGGSARILILSAMASVADKEAGLDAGADDYMTKPFDLKELSARIRALMRRSITVVGSRLVVSHLVMDLENRQVQCAGREVKLLPQEFALLEFFMRNPNRTFSPETLIKRVWNGSASVDTVRTHIKTMRKKLELPDAPELIKTMHGAGYKLHYPHG